MKTQVRPVRDLRNNYAELSRMLKKHEQIIITNNGVGEAVLISFEDYAEYEEYLHTKFINAKLAEAEKEAQDPNTQWLSHEEIFAPLRNKYEV
ncbi:MAG: type II toxin-antitoxin system Phd/YefM family antitoxin [Eubacteriaceae bacterium]